MRKTLFLLLAAGILMGSQTFAQSNGQLFRNGVAVALDGDGQAYLPAVCFLVNPCEVNETVIARGAINNQSTGEPPVGAMPFLAVNCDDFPQIPVQIWSRTGDEPWQATTTYVLIQQNLYDCEIGISPGILPTHVVANGLSVTPDGNGVCTVAAADFNVATTGEEPFIYSFSADVNDQERTYTCDDAGTNFVQLWVTDAQGRQNFVYTYLIVPQDVACMNVATQAPALMLYNGISTTLIDKQEIALQALDFVMNPIEGWTYAFSNAPADTWRIAGCNQTGTQPVYIYAFNEAEELQNTGATYFLLSDPVGTCLNPATAPQNDNVCAAISLDDWIGAACLRQFSNTHATLETGEPAPQGGACDTPDTWCDNGAATHTVWFTFTAPASGSIHIETDVFDTQLALWEAEDCDAVLNGNALLVAANDNHPGNPRGGALLADIACLIPGKVYYLQVDGNGDAKGPFTLIISDPGIECELLTGPSTCEDDFPPALSSGLGNLQHITDAQGRLIASIDDHGQNLGAIDASVQINESAIRTDDEGRPYLDRNWTITPEHQPQGPVTLRLYFSQSEWDAFQAASASTSTLDQLRVTKVSGSACGDYNGGGEVLTPVGSGQMGADIYYVTLEINSFSSFYIHGEEALVVGASETSLTPPLKAWPNPANDKVWLETPPHITGEALWQLYDARGNKVQEQNLLLSGITSIELNQLPAGSYFYRLTQSRQVIGIGKIGIVESLNR